MSQESQEPQAKTAEVEREERYPGTAEPYFIAVSGTRKVREDAPTVERESIAGLVRRKSDGKYLVLRWKEVGWETFVTGGVEEGQTPETAARAEILQETGYGNLSLVKALPIFHAKFFHVPKNENRLAHVTPLYFELDDETPGDVSSEEQRKHDVDWLTAEELKSFSLPAGHRFALGELMKS